MTVTLDGYTLNVTDITESINAVGTEWDAWENEQYTRKRKIYGKIRMWRLSCVEKDVAWSNSAANHFMTHVENGEAVTFIVDEGTRYQINTNVYIISINVSFPRGTQNIRTFSVQLREA